MVYVLDSNSLGVLKNFYPSVFGSFWEQFDHLVSDRRVVSVREVRKELERRQDSPHLLEWIQRNDSIFSGPSEEELGLVAAIFTVEHFQALIHKKQLLTGAPVADPFIVARGIAKNACVVTEERYKANAAGVPNVCQYFEVECTNIEGLLEREEWSF